jgi:hypothetical protein
MDEKKSASTLSGRGKVHTAEALLKKMTPLIRG